MRDKLVIHKPATFSTNSVLFVLKNEVSCAYQTPPFYFFFFRHFADANFIEILCFVCLLGIPDMVTVKMKKYFILLFVFHAATSKTLSSTQE